MEPRSKYMHEMKTYQKFLNESRTIAIKSKKTALDIIAKYAPWYDPYNCVTPLYRGLDNYEKINYRLTNPKKSYREPSNDAANYQQLIMDENPSWKDYPKRGYSVIGTTSDKIAGLYGGDDYNAVFRLIPLKENSLFGVCPKADIWTSFPKLCDFYSEICELFNNYEDFDIESISDWSDFLKDEIIHNIQPDYNELETKINAFYINDDIQSRISPDLKNKIAKAGGLFNYTVKLMEPKLNKFKLINYNLTSVIYNISNVFDNREVWTSAECLMVKESLLH
jgi:hypothetical protein